MVNMGIVVNKSKQGKIIDYIDINLLVPGFA